MHTSLLGHTFESLGDTISMENTIMPIDLWYRSFGLINIRNFLQPRIINSSTLTLPFNSIYHYITETDVPMRIKHTDILASPKSNIYYKYIYDYKGTTLGAYTKKSISYDKIVTDYKTLSVNIKYLKQEQRTINIYKNDTILVDYSALTFLHKYANNRFNIYYHWYNTQVTLVDTINNTETDRVNYIRIELPSIPITRQVLVKYVKLATPTSDFMSTFDTADKLNYLNLYRMFDVNSDSLCTLNGISEIKSKNTVLLLTIDNSLIPINLYTLRTLILKDKDSKNKINLTSVNKSDAQKLLYVLLYNLQIKTLMEDTVDTPNQEVDDTGNSNAMVGAVIIPSTTNIVNNKNDNGISDLDNILKNIDSKAKEDEAAINVDKIEKSDVLKTLDQALQGINITELNKETTYTDIDSIYNDTSTVEDISNSNIEALEKNGIINKKATSTYKNILKESLNIKPYPNSSQTVRDILQSRKDTNLEGTTSVNIKSAMLNTSDTKTLTRSYNKKYISEFYKDDIVKTIFSLNTANALISNYSTYKNESILGSTITHDIKLTMLNGVTNTVKIVLPEIKEDGRFVLSGNTYVMRKQLSDIPIRKIDKNKVALSSYYGKLFVTRANNKSNDAGFWIYKQLVNKAVTSPNLKKLVKLGIDNKNVDLPSDYNVLARYIKAFEYNSIDYTFDYAKRDKLLANSGLNITLASIEKDNSVLIGCNNVSYVTMDRSNLIKVVTKGNTITYESIYHLLEIDITKIPIEFISVALYSTKLPVIFLLMYYLGLTNILNILKFTYKVVDKIDRGTLTVNDIPIKFKDKYLILSRSYNYKDNLVFGLLDIDDVLKINTFDSFNNKMSYLKIFSDMHLAITYINEINMLENSYVDPITKELLVSMKEPATFIGLLIRSSELLKDDKYENPNDTRGMLVKGHERIAGLMYKQLIRAVKDYNNNSNYTKSRVNVDPYSIIKDINEDSTVMLEEDLNPLANVKQDEEITYLGAGGRSREGMSVDTRSIFPEDIGVLSEHSKDSGDVGITAGMPASANITSIRGSTRLLKDSDNWSNILSTTGVLMPFSRYDDPKRSNFSAIMGSHVIPILGSEVPYIITGYEHMIAHKAGTKFIGKAKDKGKVSNITKDTITILYNDKTEETFKLYKWTSKEEANTCYTHELVTFLKVGDTIEKDDIVTYDSAFFTPSIFIKNQVIYKQGTVVTVAISEESATLEDSGVMSAKLNSRLSTRVTHTRSLIVEANQNISNIVNVNDTVKATQPLLTISNSNIFGGQDMDERTLSILQDIAKSSPKAKYNGTINKIVVYYNCEFLELSKSLQEIAAKSDKILLANTGFTGRVNSSYSIKGIPLKPNSVEIKIYIDRLDNVGTGDKFIFCNQLKFTAGHVYTEDITTDSNIPIDAKFSGTSVFARIVGSPDLMSTTIAVIKQIEKGAINLYFN